MEVKSENKKEVELHHELQTHSGGTRDRITRFNPVKDKAAKAIVMESIQKTIDFDSVQTVCASSKHPLCWSMDDI